MEYQLVFEKAINQLIEEFLGGPYKFFTEADAVVRFHQILDEIKIFCRKTQTKDKYEVNLIHREYPTFFRFSDKNPVARLNDESKARRGHYDLVILNHEFVNAHSAATVVNRTLKAERIRDTDIYPFEAIVEFKLYDRGISKGRANSIIRELGKLNLSAEESSLRYLIVFQRYLRRTLDGWDKHWPEIEKAASQYSDINTVFAVKWLGVKGRQEVFSFGPWLNNQ